LDINASGKQVSANEHTKRAKAELNHNDVMLFLAHITLLQDKMKRKSIFATKVNPMNITLPTNWQRQNGD